LTRDADARRLRDASDLYVRVGDGIEPAPDADRLVARGYPQWPDKGPLTDGRRITLMCARTDYAAGEQIRVVHIVETVRPGDELWVMGPKQVLGEHLDGALVTEPPPIGGDPLVPRGSYDGMVLPSPAVDFNYDITTYSWTSPGVHELQWRLGPLESNILRITVQA
jgi:hypothetical protein